MYLRKVTKSLQGDKYREVVEQTVPRHECYWKHKLNLTPKETASLNPLRHCLIDPSSMPVRERVPGRDHCLAPGQVFKVVSPNLRGVKHQYTNPLFYIII